MRFALITLTISLLASAAPIAQTQEWKHRQTAFEIERELSQLPSYGVFDFVAFGLEKGTVQLVGYSYQGSLKSQASRVVKQVPGVDTVDNKIEVLPASPNDDRIRWATFYRIYGDDALSRYAPGGAATARYEAYNAARFPGLQPFGDYPIHIIVKNGRTTLVGEVDSEFDRRIAEVRAREVSGVFGIVNKLTVNGD